MLRGVVTPAPRTHALHHQHGLDAVVAGLNEVTFDAGAAPAARRRTGPLPALPLPIPVKRPLPPRPPAHASAPHPPAADARVP